MTRGARGPGDIATRGRQRGWKASRPPKNNMAAPVIKRIVEDPARKSVSTPIITSGKPALSEGPADHGELFSGNE
jgi:hypothetical protein